MDLQSLYQVCSGGVFDTLKHQTEFCEAPNAVTLKSVLENSDKVLDYSAAGCDLYIILQMFKSDHSSSGAWRALMDLVALIYAMPHTLGSAQLLSPKWGVVINAVWLCVSDERCRGVAIEAMKMFEKKVGMFLDWVIKTGNHPIKILKRWEGDALRWAESEPFVQEGMRILKEMENWASDGIRAIAATPAAQSAANAAAYTFSTIHEYEKKALAALELSVREGSGDRSPVAVDHITAEALRWAEGPEGLAEETTSWAVEGIQSLAAQPVANQQPI